MEHQPWRHNDRERPRIKYLCPDLRDEDVCLGKEFANWPVLRGWVLSEEATAHDVAMLCQKWVFSGLVRLLIEGSGKQFSLKEFVTGDDSKCLCTERLQDVIDETKYIDGLLDALRSSYGWMLKWVDVLDKRADRGVDGWSVDVYQVFWSTALLMEKCTNRWDLKYHWIDGRRISDRIGKSSQEELASRLLANRFAAQPHESNSWICPTLSRRRHMSLSENWMLFACYPSHEVHPSIARISHRSCAGHECKAFEPVGPKWTKQHDWDCTQHEHCPVISIDVGSLQEMVARYAIPLIRSTLDLEGLHIDIVDGSGVEDYSAISHVWAGGLGNEYGNDMYECQLMYLHSVVSHLAKPAGTRYYWLDTLCIPVNDTLLRQKAIDEMARIYASARNVLVIDPILRYTNLQQFSDQCSAALILASPWMGRSWTLQESALAVELCFRFRDRHVSYGKLKENSQALGKGQFTVLWTRDADMVDQESWLSSEKLSMSDKLWSTWQELCRRSSFKAEDLAAIISIFIDRSAGDVLDIRNEGLELGATYLQRRIHTLLRSTQSIPSGLLFAPAYDQTDVWCPLLPSTASRVEPRSEGVLDFTDEGFLRTNDLRSLYILRSVSSLPCGGSFYVRDRISGACFEVVFPHVPNPQALLSAANIDHILVLPRWAIGDALGTSPLHSATGLLFSMHPGAIDAEVARYKCNFRWRTVQHIRESTEALSSAAREYAVACFPPDYNSQIRDEFHLTMDMGIQDCKALSWSRKASYPFIQQSAKAARSLSMLEKVGYLEWFLFGAYMFIWLIIFCARSFIPVTSAEATCSSKERWARISCAMSIFVVGLYGQINLDRCQLRRVKRIQQNTFQKIWASTFSKQSETQDKTRVLDLGMHRIAKIAIANLALLPPLWLLAQMLPSWQLSEPNPERRNAPFLVQRILLNPLADIFMVPISAFDAVNTFQAVCWAAVKAVVVLYSVDAVLRAATLFFFIQRCKAARKMFNGLAYEPHGHKETWTNRFMLILWLGCTSFFGLTMGYFCLFSWGPASRASSSYLWVFINVIGLTFELWAFGWAFAAYWLWKRL